MKIISKFHDYYDIGLSYGIDPLITYKRSKKIIKINHKKINKEKTEHTKHFENAQNFFSFNKRYTYRPFFFNKRKTDYLDVDSFGCLCLCGKIYPFIKCKISTYQSKYSNKFEYIYTLDDLDELITKSKSDDIYYDYFKSDSKYVINRTDYDLLFNHSKGIKYNDLIDSHIYYDSPIFIYEYGHLTFNVIINPILKEFEFYKVLDPYTMFQNLSMFMSGILGNKENKAIDISDRDLKYKKGFDEKSFRKEPKQKV